MGAPLMDRRTFLGTLAGSLLAAEGQQVGRVYRIGYLTVPSRATAQGVADESAFAALSAARLDAIFVPLDSMFYQHRVRLAELAAKSRLPAMWGLREHAEAGGLLAYSTDLGDLARRAATFVDKILKGAKPADLPVEQPTKFELVINLKTAKALGLTIPPSLLARADQVIE